MDDNIAKKRSNSLIIPTGKTTDHMALKFYPESIFLGHFEGIFNQIKIDGIMNDHSSSCNS